MFHYLPPLKTLRAFEAAARLGSFTAAARELSLTQGAISYQVRRLEASLELALFQRKVRQVTLTSAGQSLYRTTHRLFRELEDEVHNIAPRQQPLRLTVSVSTFFVTRWLSQRLGYFLNDQPGLTMSLQHSVNDPEFSVEDVDLAIRWGKGDWPGVKPHKLLSLDFFPVCSPAFMHNDKPLSDIRNLRYYALLHDANYECWRDWLLLAGVDDVDARRGTVIDDTNVLIQAAMDGQGIALGSTTFVEDLLESGRLVKPFDVTLVNEFAYYVVYPESHMKNPAVRAFKDWLLSLVD